MQCNMLHAHKILPTRRTLRHRKRHNLLIARCPRHLAAAKRRALRVHFEPHGAGAVEGGGGFAAGHACHVELEGARVRDGCHGCEADCVARGDGIGGGGGAGGELVAADLGG